jgi:N-methylhydantoinase A
LKAKALRDFKAEKWPGEVQFEARSEMRYRGQGFEISIPHSARALEEFHEEHQRMYGYSRVGSPVEIVTVRLRAWIKTEPPRMALARQNAQGASPESSAKISFGGNAHKASIVDRSSLKVDKKYLGPAIVTEYSATTVVAPNWNFSLDRSGNLILEQKKRRPEGRL